jgi:hypothetical protein
MKAGAALRCSLLSLRELLISAGPLVLLAAGLLVLAYLWLAPNPPKRVTLATGPGQSAYAEFGKRYQQALKRYGIDVVLLPSGGSPANLRLLRSGRPTSVSCRAAAASATPTRTAASSRWAASSSSPCGCSTAPRRRSACRAARSPR